MKGFERLKEKKNTTCDICFLKFSTPSSLKRHAAIHLYTFYCPICLSTERSKERLVKHLSLHLHISTLISPPV